MIKITTKPKKAVEENKYAWICLSATCQAAGECEESDLESRPEDRWECCDNMTLVKKKSKWKPEGLD